MALIDMVVSIVWGKQGKGSNCVNNIFLKHIDRAEMPLHIGYNISIYSALTHHYLKENKGSRNLIFELVETSA